MTAENDKYCPCFGYYDYEAGFEYKGQTFSAVQLSAYTIPLCMQNINIVVSAKMCWTIPVHRLPGKA